MSLLSVERLSVVYNTCGARGVFKAVDDVSFSISPGQCVGLVGESGCGKSTIAHAITGIVMPHAGKIFLMDRDIGSHAQARRFWQSTKVQMIFQDPLGSLNPRLTLGASLAEVLYVHRLVKMEDKSLNKIYELLESVGLDPKYSECYPHELSGGQRQRFGIARALAVNPGVLIADEPTSSLDVSVQATILNLLKKIQRSKRLGVLFISHDLAIVRYMCDMVLVMYLGKIVEYGPCDMVFKNPSHPYTSCLVNAVQDVDMNLKKRMLSGDSFIFKGETPLLTPTKGCSFHPRCPKAQEVCECTQPPEMYIGAQHSSRCHFAVDAKGAFNNSKYNH